MTNYLELRNQVLLIRCVEWIRRQVHRLFPWLPLPTVLIVAGVQTILWLIIVAFWRLTGVSGVRAQGLWLYWGMLTAVPMTLLVDIQMSRFLRLLDEHQETIFGGPCTEFSGWLKNALRIGPQLPVALFFGLATVPISLAFFRATTVDGLGLWVTIPLDWLTLAVAMSAAHVNLISVAAAEQIRTHAARIRGFNPRRVVWVDDFVNFYLRTTLGASITGSLFVLPLILRPSADPVVYQVSLGGLGLTILFGGVPYTIAQASLSRLVARNRLCTLTEWQLRIDDELRRETPDSASTPRLEFLLNLYREAQEAEGSTWGVGATLRFMNSLLLPTLSFLILSLPTLVQMVQKILAMF